MENRNPKEELVYWINEREAVRIAKEAGEPKPWSEDAIMQDTYFCNVHREADRVTRWIRSKWKDSQAPIETLEANMCMARLVNRIESLEQLLWPWHSWYDNAFKDVAYRLKPFWGNAYVVTTHGQSMSKVDYVCGVLDRCFATTTWLTKGGTLEGTHSLIMRLEGFGSFMSAQVVADLKNTPGHPLAYAPDWSIWSAHGPGSLRGLSWFHGFKITPGLYKNSILTAKQECEDDYGLAVPMCMQDFQNCLCEYDKYMRVKNGTGRSKRRYPRI